MAILFAFLAGALAAFLGLCWLGGRVAPSSGPPAEASEHLDSADCWCGPWRCAEDVWVHRGPQELIRCETPDRFWPRPGTLVLSQGGRMDKEDP